MEAELADECDYRREAHFLRLFGTPERLGNDPRFRIPWVWQDSTDAVLVMQKMDGVSVGGNIVDNLSQDDRNEVRASFSSLCTELSIFSLSVSDCQKGAGIMHEGAV